MVIPGIKFKNSAASDSPLHMYKAAKLYVFILRCCIFFLSLFCCPVLYGQQFKVEGRVIDGVTREPIPFAGIVLKSNTRQQSVSGIEGTFSIITTTAGDSMLVSAMGYEDTVIAVSGSEKVLISLQSGAFGLEQVTVVAGKEDPAYAIVRKIIAHKKIKDQKRLDAYEYEAYKKFKIGIKNVDDQFRNRRMFKPFRFVFDNIDSTEETPYLPVFFSESLSKIFYDKQQGRKKEIIEASQSSGVRSETFKALFADLTSSFYIYDDYISLFSKSFVSPVSRSCFSHYKFQLLDSAWRNEHWSYKIEYKPKGRQQLTFVGTFWVCDTSFAITEVEGMLPENADINFITSMQFRQEYREAGKGAWMLTSDQMVVNGEALIPHEGRVQKFLAKKIFSYKNFVIDHPAEASFYKGDAEIYLEGSSARSKDYWDNARHDSLTRTERGVYHLVDSIRHMPLFKNYLAIFTGYKDFGKFELGPYYKLYTYNHVEGSRFSMGFRTNPHLSRRILLDGYGAYGLKDAQFKYLASLQYFFHQPRRQLAGLSFRHDVEQLGRSQNTFRDQDNILSTIFRVNASNKFNRVYEGKIFYEQEWLKHFTSRLSLRRSVIRPAGSLRYEHAGTGGIVDVDDIQSTEVTLLTHFAYDEKFLRGDYNRFSLGGKYPAVDVLYTHSLTFLSSDYNYQKLVLSIRQKVKLKTLGYLACRIEAGKIAGLAPYPLLEIHSGNQTVFYDEVSFNTMNFFEFASDKYASAFLSYHMEGFLLNRIPLIRWLKWREVFSVKGVVGSMQSANREALVLPQNMYVPDKGFAEAGVGIENILKILRIDGIWRLSYLDHPGISTFVVKGSLHFNF